MIHHEFGKPTPDQVTPEQLHQAYVIIEAIGQVNPVNIDPIELVAGLEGLSRALSHVVLSRGSVQITDLAPSSPDTEASINPSLHISNTLRVFDDPTTRTGMMFVVQPENQYTGATLGLHSATPDDVLTVCDVTLPNQANIDALESEDPLFWSDQFAIARDFRQGKPDNSFPFHAVYGQEGDSEDYLRIVQLLTKRLLSDRSTE